MRDPNRIDKILALIKELWMKCPDQRLGQLLINNGLVSDNIETWNIEDDEVETQLKWVLNKNES